MIRSERVERVPREVILQLAPYSATEFAHARARDIEARATEIIVFFDDDIPLLCVGVEELGLLSLADIWILRCEAFRPRHLRLAKAVFDNLRRNYRGVQTRIEDTFRNGCRFATFLGFRPTSLQYVIHGKSYTMYEAP